MNAGYINLSDDEKEEMIAFFSDMGYVYTTYAQDIDFVDKYFWKKINGE